LAREHRFAGAARLTPSRVALAFLLRGRALRARILAQSRDDSPGFPRISLDTIY
jgi:hypothetical protein